MENSFVNEDWTTVYNNRDWKIKITDIIGNTAKFTLYEAEGHCVLFVNCCKCEIKREIQSYCAKFLWIFAAEAMDVAFVYERTCNEQFPMQFNWQHTEVKRRSVQKRCMKSRVHFFAAILERKRNNKRRNFSLAADSSGNETDSNKWLTQWFVKVKRNQSELANNLIKRFISGEVAELTSGSRDRSDRRRFSVFDAPFFAVHT